MLPCQCTHGRQDAVVQKTHHKRSHPCPPAHHSLPPPRCPLQHHRLTANKNATAPPLSWETCVLESQHTIAWARPTGQHSPAALPEAVLTTGLPHRAGIPPRTTTTLCCCCCCRCCVTAGPAPSSSSSRPAPAPAPALLLTPPPPPLGDYQGSRLTSFQAAPLHGSFPGLSCCCCPHAATVAEVLGRRSKAWPLGKSSTNELLPQRKHNIQIT
jgi:hypothetical protein